MYSDVHVGNNAGDDRWRREAVRCRAYRVVGTVLYGVKRDGW